MRQEPQRCAAFRLDQTEERRALLVRLPGTIGFKAQQFTDTQCRFGATQVFRRNPETRQIFFRQINAARGVVFAHVAYDIRQLKSEAKLFRQIQGAGVLRTEHVRAGKADGAGDAITIFLEAIEGRIEVHG